MVVYAFFFRWKECHAIHLMQNVDEYQNIFWSIFLVTGNTLK